MIARQFERASQPITVTIGNRDYIATDWSPSGFQLPKGLAHGYEGKWYPVTLTITDPQNPVVMKGQAQARWSNAAQSGFVFKKSENSIPQTSTDSRSARPALKRTSSGLSAGMNPLAGADFGTPDPQINTQQKTSNEPPTLTQVVNANGRSHTQKNTHGSQTRARTGQVKRRSRNPDEVRARHASRVGFAPARIIAPGEGRVVELHKQAQDSVSKGDSLLTVATYSGSVKKSSLENAIGKERKTLESIQQSIIKWNKRTRDIDSDDGIDIDSSRAHVSEALRQLNLAHEHQKRCRGAMSRYTDANIQYRSTWKQHRDTLEKAEDEAMQRTQKALKKARFKINQLQKRHSRSLETLQSLNEQLSAASEEKRVTIRAPFNGKVRLISAEGQQAFKSGEVLMEMENHDMPMAEVLVPKQKIRTLETGQQVKTTMSDVKTALLGTVSEIVEAPSKQQLQAIGFQGNAANSPALLKLNLNTESIKLENIEEIRDKKLAVNWPK